MSVDELQNHGIGVADIQKLKLAGICTIRGVIMTTKKNLAKVKGMSDAKIEKIKEVASKMQDCGFITASELSQKRQAVFRCTSGSTDLDTLLGGGIQSMSITEIFGEFRTGKTQICMTMCITCQLPESQGGCNGKVAYIDTEGTLYKTYCLLALAFNFLYIVVLRGCEILRFALDLILRKLLKMLFIPVLITVSIKWT